MRQHYFRATGGDPSDVARRGLASAADPLPFQARIQDAFGPQHDLSSVRVSSGSGSVEANRALGSNAFTMRESIAFAGPPDLWTAAHEATHVVQQRAGLLPAGTIVPASGPLEQAADAVAHRVTAGLSAAPLLPSAGAGSGVTALQFDNPRAAEAERAVTEMWSAVNSIKEPGAEVEFLYFTSEGAMTLVEFQRTQPGQGSAASATLDDFKRKTFGFKGGAAAGSTLVTFVGTAQGYVRLKLRREQAGWAMTGYGRETKTAHPSMPPEGRTAASAATAGWPVDTVLRAQKQVARIVPTLLVYPGGTATYGFSVEFDDDRVEKLDLLGGQNKGGTPPHFTRAGSGVSLVLTNTILAFSQGLGKRKIAFQLEGAAPSGAADATWRVVSAKVDRGPQPKIPDEAEAVIADYRRMHQEIITRWREGVKDVAVYAAMFGAEQLAWWLIGGVVARGLGLVFETAAPRLIGFIRAGSKSGSRAGIEYLETMIARLPTAERAEMQAMARQAETEGIEALSTADRNRLGELLKKIEGLIDKPLTQVEKDTLRARMAARLKAAKPGIDAAFQAANRSYQIHHRLPLEYAHHFPGVDPNAAKNLIALETDVHRGVNSIWTRLRTSAPAGKVDGNTVSGVADIIDKHFGKWYDSVPASSASALTAEIDAAKSAALSEVDAIVAAL